MFFYILQVVPAVIVACILIWSGGGILYWLAPLLQGNESLGWVLLGLFCAVLSVPYNIYLTRMFGKKTIWIVSLFFVHFILVFPVLLIVGAMTLVIMYFAGIDLHFGSLIQ